jgi:lipopolysaccharide transport system ATP-binding protein
MGVSDFALQAEHISKKYRLARDTSQQAVGSFREALMLSAKRFGRRLASPWRAADDGGMEEFWALRDVSFTIEPGQVVGVIGRNGAGKSTLLKILARITEPTTGRVLVRGRMASLLEVGTGFHPELSGRENIFFNAALLGMGKAEIRRKLDEIIAFAGLQEFINTPVKRYSSGMYMRLAFSIAAHLEAEILLADEVLAVGDAEFQARCLEKMGQVAKEGRTVLFVSHHMAAIERLCQQTLILHQGQPYFFGDTTAAVPKFLNMLMPDLSVFERKEPYPDSPHLRRAFVCHPDGSPCHQPDNQCRFGVELEFCLPQSAPDLIVMAAVKNHLDNWVFSTSSQEQGIIPPDRPGLYRTRLLFPPAFFMPKDFTVALWLNSPYQIHDFHRNALSFRVAEVAAPHLKVAVKRYGDLQIRCDWLPIEPLAQRAAA